MDKNKTPDCKSDVLWIVEGYYSFIISVDNQFDSGVYYKMSIYISHLYVELDINVIVVSFDVIFSEKFIIGKNVNFLMILYLYRKKVVWIMDFGFGCEIDESVDFLGVLRYWVRYLDFGE